MDIITKQNGEKIYIFVITKQFVKNLQKKFDRFKKWTYPESVIA